LITIALQSRDGFGGIRWPDGGGLLDQPLKLIAAFEVIFAAVERFKPASK
jgi:hypothetical protein